MYPNKKQIEKLWKHANTLNTLYNQLLDMQIGKYKIYQKYIEKCKADGVQPSESIKKKYTNNELQTVVKRKRKCLSTGLGEIHSQVCQTPIVRLDKSYNNFFNGSGFPKFRSCKEFFSITYPQKGYKLNDEIFFSKVYGNIRIKKHRNFDGQIKQITIKCKNNQFYLCVTVEEEIFQPEFNNTIGIDFGLRNIVTQSDGVKIPNNKKIQWYNNAIDKLKSYRDKFCKRNSRRWKYLSSTIRKLYDKKSKITRDFLHKLSRSLVDQFDIIFVEDLKIQKMTDGVKHGLNRKTVDSAIRILIGYLEYKTRILVKVNPYNTSRTCHSCGHIHNLTLKDRTIHCVCGNIYDRDENAALNIQLLGINKLYGNTQELHQLIPCVL